MDQEIYFSVMTINDYDDVAVLWNESEGITLTDSDSKEAIRKYLQRNPNLSHVAKTESGQIIGAVLCGHDAARGYIRHLVVKPEYRHRKIGHKLVEKCLILLKNEDVYKCTVFVRSDNTAAYLFWENTGWQKRDDLITLSKVI